MRGLNLAFFILLIVILTSSCEDKTTSREDGRNQDVVAWIDNESIRLPDFESYMTTYLNLNPEFRDLPSESMKRFKLYLLNKMIDGVLIQMEAKKRGIELKPEAVDLSVSELLTSYSSEETETMLKEYYLDKNQWVELYKSDQLMDLVARRLMKNQLEVTEQEAQEYFDKNFKNKNFEKWYEVQEILLSSAELGEVILRNLRNGASFDDLVEQYSIAPDKINGGSLGYVKQGMLPYDLDKAVFALESPGDLSPLVQSGLGYHILYLAAVLDRKNYNYEEMKSPIFEVIKKIKFKELFPNWLKDLRQSYDVLIRDALLLNEAEF